MIIKADKIREYAIENGLDLTRLSNNLIRQIAKELTQTYGEEFKPSTVKLTLHKLKSRQPRYEEKKEEPPPATQAIIQHETPPQQQPPPQPPQIRLGQFIVRERPDGTAIITCPTCGTTQLDYPLPVKEKPVEVVKEVEYIPPHYFKVTCGHLDEILNLTHQDGKTIWQCPEDAKTLLQWYNQHKEELEQAAGIKKKNPDTLGKMLELGLAVLTAYEAYKRYTQKPTTTTTWTQPQPNYYTPTTPTPTTWAQTPTLTQEAKLILDHTNNYKWTPPEEIRRKLNLS